MKERGKIKNTKYKTERNNNIDVIIIPLLILYINKYLLIRIMICARKLN